MSKSERSQRKTIRRRFNGSMGVLHHGKMTITVGSQLGEGGALIKSHKNLTKVEIGQRIIVTILLAGVGRSSMKGVIATAECLYLLDENKIGVRFIDLHTSYRKKIREFVSHQKATEVV